MRTKKMDQDTEALLRLTIQQQDVKVHFQPIVHLQSQQIYGYEGLIRGPVNTVLQSSTRLFEAAMRTDRLTELDFLCSQLVIKRFAQLGLPGRLFMNVDPYSLLHENFHVKQLVKCMEHNGINPSQVIIELTETHPVENVEMMQDAMSHYRQMGFRVAIDDLGAGYSGLKLWSTLRPDIVKVDRHFILGIDQDRTKQQFVRTILRTATALGSRVITEGVETEKEYATLRMIGVEMMQGYYFSRPVEVPPITLSSNLFRKEQRSYEKDGVLTVEILIRPAVSIPDNTKVLRVGELFTTTPDLGSIVIVHKSEVLGLVLRADFMNIFASLYGKELYGKQPILRFIKRNVLQVEKNLPLEEVSFRLTSSQDLYTDEFIILDGCRLAGKGRLIDLLHEITKLQINRARHANPLTQLPGNVLIQQELNKLFHQAVPFVVCYFDLDNFKPFNDFFGFIQGDKVLRFVSELLVANIDDQMDFIGHVGGDDFVAIFHSTTWQSTVQRILLQFNDGIIGFYSSLSNGIITTTDREGEAREYGVMTLSVGAVVIYPSEGRNCLDLSEEAAFAKHQAKAIPGSSLYIHKIEPDLSEAVAQKSSLIS